MKKTALSVLCICFAFMAFSQKEVKENEIDLRLKACLDSSENQTTMAMMDCEGKARDSWDLLLNKNYRLLMSVISSEDKEKLKVSQKSWILYRDNEFMFSSSMFYNQEGTLWRIVAVDRQVEIVKARALELANYYKLLTENN